MCQIVNVQIHKLYILKPIVLKSHKKERSVNDRRIHFDLEFQLLESCNLHNNFSGTCNGFIQLVTFQSIKM